MTITRQNELNRLRAEVSRLDLQGRDAVLALTLDELDAAFNGCGPEFLPDAARQTLDRVTTVFAPAFMVHDVEFTLADGLKVAFDAANLRLLVNCAKCALDAAPWNSLRRYALLGESWAIYRACDRFGWSAWLAAYNKNQTNKEERMRR